MDKVNLYAPIEKTDEELRMVYGYASTEAIDSQGEIVEKEALAEALTDYMKYANIREMHQPSAVGKTKQANLDKKGLYISVKVVDDNAWKKVKEGVYNGFSIGGRVLQMVDNKITNLKLAEISLVDRPANPEAVFDVYKVDEAEIEKKEEKIEKLQEEVKEMKKSLWDVSFLVDTALNLYQYICSEEYEGEPQPELKTALETIKGAIATELAEAEDYPEVVVMAVELAQKTIDLHKQAEQKCVAGKDAKTPDHGTFTVKPLKDQAINDEGKIVKQEDQKVVPQSEQVVPIEGTSEVKPAAEQPVTEEGVVVKPAINPEVETPIVVEEQPVALIVEAPVEEKVIETPVVVEEPVIEPEKTAMEKVAIELEALKMPSEELITELLKAEGTEVSDKTIGVLKFELAGKIVEKVSEQMATQKDLDLAKNDAEKAQKEVGIIVADKKGQFDGVNEAILKLEEVLKSTSKEVVTLPASQVSPESPAEVENPALTLLRQAIALLTSQSTGGQKTPKQVAQQAAHQEGAVGAGVVINNGKSDKSEDLVKMETELTNLKEQLKKLADQPMPVKVKTSYTVVEKFEDMSGELGKAEARSDELVIELAKDPNNQALIKEAGELGTKIMALKRA